MGCYLNGCVWTGGARGILNGNYKKRKEERNLHLAFAGRAFGFWLLAFAFRLICCLLVIVLYYTTE